MIDLIRAELLKIRATRSTWYLGVSAVLFCAGWAALSALVFLGSAAQETMSAEQEITNVYQMAQMAFPFTLLLGLVGMSGEYRYQTITWSFLVSPRRDHVVIAKLLAYGVLGLIVGVVCAVTTAAASALFLSVRGSAVVAPAVPLVLLGAVASSLLFAVLGVAIGALIRNQAVAIALSLTWFFYMEYALIAFFPEYARWLPGGAAKAVSGMHLSTGELLPAWAGGLLFIGYTLLAATFASRTTLRRDVT
ncbi:ABC transporter permease [Nonomuraea sp. NPDC046570]|uniref:ABC transporter permease n=1 Tax=Nonomuraea sp. NPDC046570 TaxID=3155255 RepID=UPI0033CA5F93